MAATEISPPLSLLVMLFRPFCLHPLHLPSHQTSPLTSSPCCRCCPSLSLLPVLAQVTFDSI